MTYAVANLFGRSDKFNELLEKINFTDKDYMYILGDIIDHGEDPVGLITEISMRYNIYSVLGDHEIKALDLLTRFEELLKSGEAPDKEFSSKMLEWAANGGQTTLEAFKDSDADTREGFIDYLDQLPAYEEAFVGNKEYYLINKGISNYEEGRAIDGYSANELVLENIDLKKKYFANKTLVCGYYTDHNATEEEKCKAHYGNESIILSFGADHDDKVACLRLEDGKEFYV